MVAAVQLLPERQRDAIVQRGLEGRSYDEIAASIGVSNGAVRQLLSRARMTLRAGATAITPFGLLARVPWTSSASGGDAAVRVAEICGGTAGGAVLAKACATALVSGAVLGGTAAVTDGEGESEARRKGSPGISRQGGTGPAQAVVPRRAVGAERLGLRADAASSLSSAATWPSPQGRDSDDEASATAPSRRGVVRSSSRGVLRIDLANGSYLTRLVTEATEIGGSPRGADRVRSQPSLLSAPD